MHSGKHRPSVPGEQILNWMVTLELWVAAALLTAMVIINVAEVAARYLFRHSFLWVQDVTVLLAAWMIFLGFTAVVHHGRDIAVTFVVDRLPARARAFFQLLGTLGAILFLAVTTWQGLSLLEIQRGDTSHMARIPLTLYTWPLIVGAVSLLLLSLAEVIRNLAVLVRGDGGAAG